jgi:Zn-dependent peptidase ImmA (M78 family)
MHEYGHVKLHDFLYKEYRLKLISTTGLEKGPRCLRATILTQSSYDWLEWQASYASGAFLIPITYLKKMAGQFLREKGCYQYFYIESPEAQELINRVSNEFQVSADASRVRLFQQKYISTQQPSKTLF